MLNTKNTSHLDLSDGFSENTETRKTSTQNGRDYMSHNLHDGRKRTAI